MEWKKNDVFQVKIEDMSDAGEGIGKTEGFTWFVKDAVIGDRVEAKAMKVKKTYGFARLLRVLEPSPFRVTPPCPVARQCGGCQLQAMSYEEQLRFKEDKVFHNLVRIGGIRGLRGVGGTQETVEQGSLGQKMMEQESAGQEMVGQKLSGQELVKRQSLGQELSGQELVKRQSLGQELSGQELTEKLAKCDCPGEELFYPIIGMENPWRYRNKAQFPFGRNREGKIITGFYAGRTHSIIENEDCLLGVPENGRILACIRDYMEEFHIQPYDEVSHRGLVRHVLIRKGFRTGELMVCLVLNGAATELKESQVLVERLKGLFEVDGDAEAARPEIVSISCSINCEKTNVIMGQEIVNLYGPGYITDYIGNVCYRISPLSFYQVNPVQTERLYGMALEYAGLTGGEVVWDLYCGIGTISLFLAQKAGKVYGVEIVPQAIADARANAKLNGIDNVEFFVGKAEEVLPEQYERHGIRADVVVVDPPRKGCDKVCLDTIIKMAPQRVVYVSCDSATLARDLKYLGEGGYEVRKVRAVDMFGQGVHVETVCLLSNRKPDTKVRIDVDLEDYYRIKDAKKNQN